MMEPEFSKLFRPIGARSRPKEAPVAPTTPTPKALFTHLRSLWRAQWLSLVFTITGFAIAVANQHWLIAVAIPIIGFVIMGFLNTRVLRIYRTKLDPCQELHVETITDVALLVDYYTAAAKGPEAITRPWLAPLTFKRMVRRRAGNPWWAPLGNTAYSCRLSAERSTVIMPFLTNWLLNTTSRDDTLDTVAIATVNLRTLWATDIVRQQGKDAVKAEKAAEAWLLLGL